MRLILSALTKFILGLALVGALLFLPAWTLDYTGAWLFLGVLFIPMLLMGIVMLCKSPDLLRKRLDGKEKQATQRGVVGLSGLMFLGGFIVSALDHRFGWSCVPLWCVIAASVLFLGGYAMYAEVMRENVYLSRTIEVQEGQRVIDTGLYGIVRHPMYSATLLLFLSMPIVLGSVWSFLIFLAYPFIIAARLKDEEKFLEEELEGYREYKKKVKYRLIPFIW
jgi:protein-S-isoprenylcysteine O-methyltransferase Ste14